MNVLLGALLVGLAACVNGTVFMTIDEDADFETNAQNWEAEIDDTANGGMQGVNFGLQKDPCCVPDQWEGGASETIESITFSHSHRQRPRVDKGFELMEVHVDLKNKRIAVEEHMYSRQGISNHSVILDGKNHVMYVILPDLKICRKMPFAGNLSEQCLPPTSKYIGSATFGLGDNSLNYDAFGVRDRYGDMSIGAMALMTSDSCAPITRVGKGRAGHTFFWYSAAFFNLKAGIKDTKVFTPPDYCQKEMEEDLGLDNHPVVNFATRTFLK